MPIPQPLDRRSFDAAVLMAEHPPRWEHPNKRLAAEVSCPAGARHSGTIGYSRWSAPPLPATLEMGDLRIVERPGFYDYTSLGDAAVEWHVNFADPHLFVAYGSDLLAQDELQVLEHPALGALKEALVADGAVARTTDDDGPTPVLVTGVERRCRLATDPDASAGRPDGLYGNRFAAATQDVVRRALAVIEPPTRTNLIAMAAPAFGEGAYTAEQIERVLVTAVGAFGAAVAETADGGGDGAGTVVHTGYWGCGAFGGNRILMAALQVLAARMSGVGTLAFHGGDARGSELFADALAFVEETPGIRAARSGGTLVAAIADYGFRWGVPDGT